MKRIIALLLLLVSVFTVLLTARIKVVNAEEVNSSARACVVIESNSKRVLFEKNMNTKLAMASTTKIMTALITLEKCEDLDEIVKIDDRSVGIEGTSIYLRKGEELTVKELLYGLILASGNDASLALAYHIGKGNLQTFVDLMNDKAKELNLKNTCFANPHGLDAENHYTSAYDLAVITSEALKNADFREICSTQITNITGNKEVGNRFLRNKQKLLKTLKGCNGVKSGFTDNAGRCLVTSCERENFNIICVVLNCPDMFEESARLINKAYLEYRYTELLEPYYYLTSVPVTEGVSEEVRLFTMKSFCYPLKDGEIVHINIEKEIPETLSAPLEKEQIVGKISIFFDKDLIFSENIYTMESVESKDIKDKINDIIDKWFYEG